MGLDGLDDGSINKIVELLDRRGIPTKDQDGFFLWYAQEAQRMGSEFAASGDAVMARTHFDFADSALTFLSLMSLLYVSKECIFLRKLLKGEREVLSRTHPSSEPLNPDLTKNEEFRMNSGSELVNELGEFFDRRKLPKKDRDELVLRFAQEEQRMGSGFAASGEAVIARTHFELADSALVLLSKSSLLYLSKECILLRKSVKAERDKLSRTHHSNEPLRPDLTQNVAKFVRRN